MDEKFKQKDSLIPECPGWPQAHATSENKVIPGGIVSTA